MKQYAIYALAGIVGVILLNAVASMVSPVKSALNSIPGNANTWG